MQMIASNPERISQFLNDPDLQRLMQKLQSLGLSPSMQPNRITFIYHSVLPLGFIQIVSIKAILF